MSSLPDDHQIELTYTFPLGRTLREARERAGLSVEELATKIKFKPPQIVALEADQFQQDYAAQATFVRGFVRVYARAVNLNEQTLLSQLPVANSARAVRAMTASVDEPIRDGSFFRRPNTVWLIAAVVLALVVLSLVVWQMLKNDEPAPEHNEQETLVLPLDLPAPDPASEVVTALPFQDMVSQVAAVSAPAVAEPVANSLASSSVAGTSVSGHLAATNAPVAPQSTMLAMVAAAASAAPVTTQAAPSIASSTKPPTPPSPAAVAKPVTPPLNARHGSVRFAFVQDSWVEVKDANGKIISSKVSRAGSELEVEGLRPFSLVVGNAYGVQLFDGASEIDLRPYTGVKVARLTVK